MATASVHQTATPRATGQDVRNSIDCDRLASAVRRPNTCTDDATRGQLAHLYRVSLDRAIRTRIAITRQALLRATDSDMADSLAEYGTKMESQLAAMHPEVAAAMRQDMRGGVIPQHDDTMAIAAALGVAR